MVKARVPLDTYDATTIRRVRLTQAEYCCTHMVIFRHVKRRFGGDRQEINRFLFHQWWGMGKPNLFMRDHLSAVVQ